MSESRQANPTAAILIVGDEILSGRTRDANMHYLAGELNRIGIALKEVRIVSDNHRSIMAAVNALRVAFDHVFTSGGIGPTHDDITADAIAAAFDVAIGAPCWPRIMIVTAWSSTRRVCAWRVFPKGRS